ncbi:hypothetical protein IWW38_001449 [Coemansia aciculifera]|uniref:Uncharacterized protein n=1 Tax=Coemansia aciculifera TaxID=417176 RepID=A0ACC1M847_9FUNG|nr:hypothetical protein IWW38_001449 [Coemansia aciculifera]
MPGTETPKHSKALTVEQDDYDKDSSDTDEDVEAREEEDINEFLTYLKDESQRVTTEQSAVYFQLRSEAESAELGAHNEGMWRTLLDVDWDRSLKDVTANTTLQELLDTDHEFLPTDETQQQEGNDNAAIQTDQVRSIVRQMNAVELAPSAKPVLRQPVAVPSSVAKGQAKPQPADDLEAFLDDLL